MASVLSVRDSWWWDGAVGASGRTVRLVLRARSGRRKGSCDSYPGPVRKLQRLHPLGVSRRPTPEQRPAHPAATCRVLRWHQMCWRLQGAHQSACAHSLLAAGSPAGMLSSIKICCRDPARFPPVDRLPCPAFPDTTSSVVLNNYATARRVRPASLDSSSSTDARPFTIARHREMSGVYCL